MELSLHFEDNNTGHRDLILQFAGEGWCRDTYYLALDELLLPEREDAGKIQVVLQRLLEQWSAAVESMGEDNVVYLPYDFSDQYTGWLKCVRADDTVTVSHGWSFIEGHSIVPSEIGELLANLPGFTHNGPAVQVSVEELRESIRVLQNNSCAR